MIFTCRHCQKNLELKNKYTKTGHLSKCLEYKKWRDTTFTKDFLIEEYEQKGKSALEIAVEHGMPSSAAINRLLAKFEIPKRGISAAFKMPRSYERRIATNIELYGAYNVFCRESTSRKEWEQRLFDTEGITNVFQRPDVIDKCQKSRAENPKRSFRFTKPHKTVVETLISANIPNVIEYAIQYKKCYGTGGYKFYDIFIIGTNKLIEVNGEFYHADPRCYKVDDIITPPGGQYVCVKDIWEKDAQKLQIAYDAGYEVLVLWERDINDGSFKDVLWDYLG